MKYLLDTHVLLWWFESPALLSSKGREIIENPENIIFVSSVSTWEIVIKKSLGKLKVPDEIFDLVEKENFTELPVSVAHTRCLQNLQNHHNDPFDRLLIAQSMAENLIILTRDEQFKSYDAKICSI